MSKLPSRSEARPDLVHIVIDTPKGSRNKYKFDDALLRNDRLVAVPVTEVNAPPVGSLAELSQTVLDEVEHFFESYNRAQGRHFEACGRLGPDAAERLVDAAIDTHSSHSRR